MSLLETALRVNVPKKKEAGGSKFTFDERLELAIAWVNREVTIDQVRAAMEVKSTGNARSSLGAVIGVAIRRGLIKIERV